MQFPEPLNEIEADAQKLALEAQVEYSRRYGIEIRRPDMLAEGIYIRMLADRDHPPTMDQIIAYIDWVIAHAPEETLSGRGMTARRVHITLEYRSEHGSARLVKIEHRKWKAHKVGTGDYVASGSGRTRAMREVEREWPGGEWHYILPQRDGGRMLQRWRVAEDWARDRK